MTQESLLHVLFIFSVVSFLLVWIINIISVGISKDKFFTSTEGLINIVIRSLLLGSGFIGALLYSINPNIMAWSIIHLPQQIRWMGFILTMVGIIIFTWVLRSLGHNFSTTLTIRSDQTLIKSGPYKWVRHPMYTAFIIIWLGFFFIQ